MSPDPSGAYRARLDAVPLSVLGTTVARLEAHPPEARFPLHQGISWFAAPIAVGDGSPEPHPLAHDGPPQGLAYLLDAVQASLGVRLARAVDRTALQITNGITHGLHLAFGALLAPGDEVVLLSPHWLFVPGIVAAWGGVCVELRYFLDRADDADTLAERLRRVCTDRTRAIYFNSPNNPSGVSLRRWEIAAICAFARARGIHVVADNAYEDFDFSEDGFVDAAAADMGPDIAFGLYSMSKSYGHTGLRIGYMTMPAGFSQAVRVLALHSIYCVSTVAQTAAWRDIRDGDAFRARHRTIVRGAMATVLRDLRVPFVNPDGGFYALLDLADYPGGADRFLDRAVARGVSLTPGRAFGTSCAEKARLCYACVPDDRLATAIGIVNAVYAAG